MSGKYNRLTEYLLQNNQDEETMSFHKIESILGFVLPDSARRYPAWWSNNPKGHSHSLSWIKAGYLVIGSANAPSAEIITFVKKGEHFPIQRNKSAAERRVESKPLNVISTSISEQVIKIGDYSFHQTPFAIYEKDIPSPFLDYKNRTVDYVLNKKHYYSLTNTIRTKYAEFLNEDIQIFMKHLVASGDDFYLRFLNKNGADRFCYFGLTDKSIFWKKGLYLYKLNDSIVYIGRCLDNYNSRFNVNYGKISPINCYKEGQSTNTHMNSLMNQYGENIGIYLSPMEDRDEIVASELKLIRSLLPCWNRQR